MRNRVIRLVETLEQEKIARRVITKVQAERSSTTVSDALSSKLWECSEIPVATTTDIDAIPHLCIFRQETIQALELRLCIPRFCLACGSNCISLAKSPKLGPCEPNRRRYENDPSHMIVGYVFLAAPYSYMTFWLEPFRRIYILNENDTALGSSRKQTSHI